MPTRDLQTNERITKLQLQKLVDKYIREEVQSAYRVQLEEVTAIVSRLLDVDPADLTKAQRTQLLRNSNILQELADKVEVYVLGTRETVEALTKSSFDASYFKSAWAVNQYTGVNLQWGGLSEQAVAAAVGIGGNTEALAKYMPVREVLAHKKVLDRALDVNYRGDARKWISLAVTDGITRGEGIGKIKARLKDAIGKTASSFETIARTETLRSLSLGSQIAYEDAADQGVQIRQVWDATLDSSTRPDHADMDGRYRDEETGVFQAPWGSTPGPHRNGIASQDINCRCDVRPEVEGFSPEVRRVRGEGIVPYTSFREWAQKQGITANRFGRKYNFM